MCEKRVLKGGKTHMGSLRRLNIPSQCSLFVAWMRQCRQPAYWLLNGETVCNEHIRDMSDLHMEPDFSKHREKKPLTDGVVVNLAHCQRKQR